MKKKNPYRIYAFWRKTKKVLSGMGAQDFELLQRSTRGAREDVYYIRGSFMFTGVKKTLRIVLMPTYSGAFGISAEYRDELTLIVRNSQIAAKDIRFEMNRLIDIWELGIKSENLFVSCIKKSYMYAHAEKTSESDDRNNHVDFILYLYGEDGKKEGPTVSVDVKSSMPAHIPSGTLVYRRDDGVYVVDANEVTIAAHAGWADAVITEILFLEQGV